MKLEEIVYQHSLWLIGRGGKRANLTWANLRGVDLRGVDLRGAGLYGTNLQEADLQEADLRRSDLQYSSLIYANLKETRLSQAILKNADLYGAKLNGADLRWANLQGANLRDADLRRAILDFSSGIPFKCGGIRIKGDDRLFAQILYHLEAQDWSGASEDVQRAVKKIKDIKAPRFHQFRKDVPCQK